MLKSGHIVRVWRSGSQEASSREEYEQHPSCSGRITTLAAQKYHDFDGKYPQEPLTPTPMTRAKKQAPLYCSTQEKCNSQLDYHTPAENNWRTKLKEQLCLQ